MLAQGQEQVWVRESERAPVLGSERAPVLESEQASETERAPGRVLGLAWVQAQGLAWVQGLAPVAGPGLPTAARRVSPGEAQRSLAVSARERLVALGPEAARAGARVPERAPVQARRGAWALARLARRVPERVLAAQAAGLLDLTAPVRGQIQAELQVQEPVRVRRVSVGPAV